MIHRGIELQIIENKEWGEKYSEQAHLIAFGKEKPKDWDRIDYAILLVEKAIEKPAGYVTCRETDHETVYWQFGGAMPETAGGPGAVRAFECALEWSKHMYKRVTFVVQNDNVGMLKLALKYGFKIMGVRAFKGTVLLEHMKEF